MPSKRPLGLAAAMLLTCAPSVWPQTSRSDPSDLQAWYGTALNLRLPQQWRAQLKYRLRTEGNASHYRGSYFYAELGQRLRPGLTLQGGYRLALASNGTAHRYSLGLQAARELAGIEFSLRPTVQHQRRQLADDDEGAAKTMLRTRLKAEYPLSRRLEIYGSVEPFFPLGADPEYPIDNWRNTVGLAFEYAKNKKVDLFYIYRPDYAKNYNRTFHVIGMELDFRTRVRRNRNT